MEVEPARLRSSCEHQDDGLHEALDDDLACSPASASTAVEFALHDSYRWTINPQRRREKNLYGGVIFSLLCTNY
jgi:hypothetical protein